MTIYFGMVRSTNDNAWKTCKMSKVYACSHEITNKPCMSLYYKETIMLRSMPQMLKKWRIIEKRISKVRQTTCNWIKKILDKATWMANVFLISWFFYLFLSCSISLLVKYDFILRYEAWVNAIRASSFFENVPQISAKPSAFQRNLLGKLPRNRPFFTNHFSEKLASKIPTKSAIFFREFVPENPPKFDCFSATYQKPWYMYIER